MNVQKLIGLVLSVVIIVILYKLFALIYHSPSHCEMIGGTVRRAQNQNATLEYACNDGESEYFRIQLTTCPCSCCVPASVP